MCSSDIITITLSRHLTCSCCCWWWWCIMHTYDFLLSFTCKRIPHRTLFILRIRIFTLRSGAAECECWERVNRSRVFSISGTTDLAWFAWSCVTFSKRREHQNHRSDVTRWTYSRVLFSFPFFRAKKFSLRKILAWRLWMKKQRKRVFVEKGKKSENFFSFVLFFFSSTTSHVHGYLSLHNSSLFFLFIPWWCCTYFVWIYFFCC